MDTSGAGRGEPRAADRRACPRFPVVENRARLDWGDSDGFQVVDARLVDISRGGAALETEQPLPVGDPVWFCLDPDGRALGVGARVLGCQRDWLEYRVRLRFDEPCPEPLLRLAIRGPSGHRLGRILEALRSLLGRARRPARAA